MIGGELDWMLLAVFSNVGDPMILYLCSCYFPTYVTNHISTQSQLDQAKY